jgi:hypothetical protein
MHASINFSSYRPKDDEEDPAGEVDGAAEDFAAAAAAAAFNKAASFSARSFLALRCSATVEQLLGSNGANLTRGATAGSARLGDPGAATTTAAAAAATNSALAPAAAGDAASGCAIKLDEGNGLLVKRITRSSPDSSRSSTAGSNGEAALLGLPFSSPFSFSAAIIGTPTSKASRAYRTCIVFILRTSF